MGSNPILSANFNHRRMTQQEGTQAESLEQVYNLIFFNMFINIRSSTQVGDGHFKRAPSVTEEASLKWRSGRNS